MGEASPATVYVLCFLTSAACAWLLGRSYYRTRAGVLLWSAICFGLLAANNLVLVFDMLILPDVDLKLWRLVLTLAAVVSLIWGFIWEVGED